MKRTSHKTLLTGLLLGLLAGPVLAHAEASAASTVASKDLTEGEIRKVDLAQKKLTIKHGEIRNLEMPPMTMVFRVKDASVLTSFKPGDKVRFQVEKLAEGLTITTIEPGN